MGGVYKKNIVLYLSPSSWVDFSSNLDISYPGKLEAEWTKSGDMVVDDSEAEQEVGVLGKKWVGSWDG